MDYITPFLTFLSFIAGAGVAWGMMRATIARLVQDVDKLSVQIAKTAECLAHMDSMVKDVARLSAQMDRSTELFQKFELECRMRFAAEDAQKARRRKRK